MVVSNIFYVHPEPWGNDPFWLIFSDGLKPPTSYDLFRWTSYRLIANHEICSKLRLIDRDWNLISPSCQWLESHGPRCVACLGFTGHDWTATGTFKKPNVFFWIWFQGPDIFPFIRFPTKYWANMYNKSQQKRVDTIFVQPFRLGVCVSRWWFQIFFLFIPTWGNDPIWLMFFKWVATAN